MNIERFDMGPRFCEMSVVDTGTVKFIYLAGQVADNTGYDVTGQTREILGRIDQLLARAGADKTHIVAATVYLASPGDYAAMNSVWDDWVPQGHTPARATVGAKMVDPGYKVEVQLTAVVASS